VLEEEFGNVTDNVQGILPIIIEESTRSGLSPTRPKPIRGVQASDPRGDMFIVDDGASRRGGSIAGQVTKINYSNFESGYHILRVRLEENGSVVTFVGPSEAVSVGDRVEGVGRWEHHGKHGLQLKARFIRVLIPSTGKEIYAFLASGGVRGVSNKSAEKLLDKFGDKLSEVLTSPTAMISAGITEKQANAISETWTMRSTHTEVTAFLQSLSLGPATAQKIVKKYGEKTRQMISANPYRIARDIPGIGFKTSDQMALALSMDRRDARRIDAAILHVMNQIGRDGNCACPRQTIVKEVRKLLNIEINHIKEGIIRLIEKRLLIEEENGGAQVIYEANVLKCEEEIAKLIVELNSRQKIPDDIDEMIDRAATETGIPGLHEHQALAVKQSIGSQVSVITGGPGSGKTSSLEVLLRVFERLNPGCLIGLCAPTGRAAQRMAESTGREAKTIHRELEWAPDRGGFQRNADNPLDYDLLVVDEASMLDIWLARDVLRALKDGASLVLLGDVDQLPSVGAGRVLGDIIDSGVVTVTTMTKIFRQGAGSQIAEVARTLNSGRMPKIDTPNKKTDMWAVWDYEPEASLPRIAKMVSQVAPSLGYDPLRDVQVLTAGHNGILGTINLNITLQEALNPETSENPGAKIGDRTFRVGDRVIQMSNDYDLDVFNGDIGQVVDISAGRKKDSFRVSVDFDGRVIEFLGVAAKNLNLAYAISVHKSQGSEFPFVIFVPSTQHYTMLRKTLIYTAITRAKKICAIIGQEKAARVAVKKSDRSRVTGLNRRLTIEAAEVDRLTGAA
jgi:exodeoxyribonuclease V alpha subunit